MADPEGVIGPILVLHYIFGVKLGIFFAAVSIVAWRGVRDYSASPDSLPLPSVVRTSQEMLFVAVRVASVQVLTY